MSEHPDPERSAGKAADDLMLMAMICDRGAGLRSYEIVADVRKQRASEQTDDKWNRTS